MSGSAAAAPRIPPGHLNPAAFSQLQTPACSKLMSPSCCVTASRFLPLEPPWAGEEAELGRMTAKLSHGRAERQVERSERAGGQASATRAGSDRCRRGWVCCAAPLPGRSPSPGGSGHSLPSQRAAAGASVGSQLPMPQRKPGVCAAAFSGGISLLQENQIRILGELFF